jgi:hypothetical protein
MTEPLEVAVGFFDRFSDPKTFGLVALGLFAAGVAIGFKLAGGMPVELEQPLAAFQPVETSPEAPYVEPIGYVESPAEFEVGE